MKDTPKGNAEAFKVNSLTNLDTASPVEGKVVWDAPRSLWNAAMMLGALVMGPLYFTWDALLVFLVTTFVTLCAGHSVGFHRRLIHRSFDCPKWVERTLMWFGTCVGMGGPIWTIRLHDTRDWAQRQPDCHWFLRHGKPLLIEGFYYLHFKVKLDRPPGFDPGPGIADDPFYRFLERTWMWQQLPVALVLYALGGWPWVVWGVFVRVTACTTMHWYISHKAHTTGPQDWIVDGAVIQAHNVPIMAIPTMGEAWHGNHHAFPSSARHGLYPGQIDLGWHFVQFLELLGLAWNVKVPAKLPPRPGITPVSQRALSIAAPGQADLSGVAPRAGTMEDDLSAAEALRRFRRRNGIAEDNADTWTCRLGPLTLRLPNFQWRRRAIARHDLHHILTGYPCTLRGECRMAAWEFAAGRYPHPAATLFCLPLVALGVLLSPRALWAAFRAGRRSESLYGIAESDDLLRRPLPALRAAASCQAPHKGAARDALAFSLVVAQSFLLLLGPTVLAAVLLLL